ncbi:myosin-13-like [Montipora foliosa]|uniref:myosin-13-like n=1 Tax=Montipora foliosa TaxID=591990 RepID=UPI0035F14116
MSWARDEWKIDLPTAALKKITELENDAENLRKNKQQQQFQLESVSSALQKQKQVAVDEKNASASLRREVQELTRNFSALESENEKMQVDLRAKDNKMELLEDQLHKARARLKDEEEKNTELTKKLDEQYAQVEGNESNAEELRKELEALKNARNKIEKELEAAKDKVESLCKEIDTLKDQVKDRDELLTEHSIEEENASFTDAADPTTVPSVGGAFLEILKRENNALISVNEELKAQVDQVKNVLREKEKELERVMEKLASSNAEKEKALNELKVKERETVKLERKLHNTEEDLRKARDKVGKLEKAQLSGRTDVKKHNAEKEKENLSNELEKSLNKIRTLETEVTLWTNQVKAKQDRLETLEEENIQITEDLASLRRQKDGAMDSYLELTTVLKEKEKKIKELENDSKEKKKQLRAQSEKSEILETENIDLKEELESYRLVSVALDESRKALKNDLGNNGENRLQAETGEGLEKRKNGYADAKSSETNSKNCHNCDQFKARLQDQQELFSRRVRELETCIQDLATEKEALEQKLYNQRRSSEEFTSRVQQMVQKLEIEQRVHKKEKRETGGKTRETENFFSMVKRFFTEHEPMKNHAQVCLRDLRQIQQCFQSCSKGAKEVISHVNEFETVAKRISLLKSLLQSVVDEFAWPLNDEGREPIAEKDDSPPEPNIKAEMAWDHYERDLAFNAFKGDVEDILEQLETDKKIAERRAEEMHELKRAHLALKKVRKRSRHETESASSEDLETSYKKEPYVSVSHRFQESTQMDAEYLVDVMRDLTIRNREELEIKMCEYFKRLENTLISQRGQRIADTDHRKEPGVENFKDVMDGRFAIGELEIVRRKICDVQKSIKHLVGSLAETEKEKKSVESKIDLLNGELCRKESLYKEKCEDLKRAAKTATEHEKSLRSRIDGLTSEKDELNTELRRIVAVLKKKEVELVEGSQELKHLQAAYKDEKRTLQNKITSLEQENDGLWLDYKEADKRAEIKEKEFKELVDRLKASQGYLHTMFNSLTNMDDELQRARDIHAQSEHDSLS